MRCALARAYGDLEALEPAIGHVEKALALEHAEVPLSALEELSNLQARLAATLPPAGRERAQALIAAASARLGMLQGLADTIERRNLQGSLWKRRALLATRASERETALAGMARAYAAAYELGRARRGEGDPYALLNWRVAEVLAAMGRTGAGRGRRRAGGRAGSGAIAGGTICGRPRRSPPGATMTTRASGTPRSPRTSPSCAICTRRTSTPTSRTIAAGYERAIRRGATRRELGSERDHLEFLLRMVRAIPDRAARGRLVGALEAIRERVVPGPARAR